MSSSPPPMGASPSTSMASKAALIRRSREAQTTEDTEITEVHGGSQEIDQGIPDAANRASHESVSHDSVSHESVSQETMCWLALALTPGLGPSRIRKLIEHFGSAERVMHASLTELEASGMRAVSAQSIATGKSLGLAQDELAKALQAGARIIALSDPEYPPRLKEIYDPPVILFVKGSVELLVEARYRDGGDAASDALRQWHGRTPGDRSGGTRAGDHQRHGAWHRYGLASRSDCRQRKNDRGALALALTFCIRRKTPGWPSRSWRSAAR